MTAQQKGKIGFGGTLTAVPLKVVAESEYYVTQSDTANFRNRQILFAFEVIEVWAKEASEERARY